jgi:phage portal protein BeeE
MRLLDRVKDRYRDQGYYEGMASGAAVYLTYGADNKREIPATNLIAEAQHAYASNGVVFAVSLARMMLLSEATFKLRNKVTKDLYGTEDLRILEFPWPNGSTGDLWARMELDVTTAGNFFAARVEDDELLRLPPAETTIISEVTTSSRGVKYKRVIGYDWDPSKGAPGAKRDAQAQFFPVDEVAHWAPYADPFSRVRGMTWLTPILREVYADSGMVDYKAQYLDHGTPLVAVKYPAKLRPETIDAVVERIAAKYGGVSNAFKTLVFDQGADPILGQGLKDMDFAAVQDGGEFRICADGGVPAIVVGLRGAQPESYPGAMRRFADMTCRPLWRSGCAALQKLVPNIPDKGVQLWVDTSDIAALQAAETERAQVTQVSAAAMLTFVQAGMKRDSVIAAVTSGDLSLLVPDPDAPTPGVTERETITAGTPFGTDPATVAANGSSTTQTANGRPQKAGQAPGTQTVLTKPQTPASKTPMPSSFPKMPATTGRRGPSPNGKA